MPALIQHMQTQEQLQRQHMTHMLKKTLKEAKEGADKMKFTSLTQNIEKIGNDTYFTTTFETDEPIETPYKDFLSRLYDVGGIYISALGLYKVGTDENDAAKKTDEYMSKISISRDFIMGKYDITVKTLREFTEREY